LADGKAQVYTAIELPISWIGNTRRRTSFYVVNDNSDEILLGRPFLSYAKIGITPDGYFSTKKPDSVYQFAPSPQKKFQSYRISLEEQRTIYNQIRNKHFSRPEQQFKIHFKRLHQSWIVQ
jgi:hypothetical protein